MNEDTFMWKVVNDLSDFSFTSSFSLSQIDKIFEKPSVYVFILIR
jgi:hypothetical protein